MGEEMTTNDRILHVATDRAGRTWRVLERDDGSFSVYYSMADDPPMTKRILRDTADYWSDPPRVLLARAERAEQRASAHEYRIVEQQETISWLRDGLRGLRGRLSGKCICGETPHALHCPVYLALYFTALLEGTPLPE